MPRPVIPGALVLGTLLLPSLSTSAPKAPNQGGPFGYQADLSVPALPTDLKTADLNGDGHRDLITSHEGGTLFIRLGNGNGTFQAATTLPIGNIPRSLFAGDLTGDGKTDLLVGKGESNSLAILVNDGTGGFIAKPEVSFPDIPMKLAIADVDEDGMTDVLATSVNEDNWPNYYGLYWLKGHGDGTFGSRILISGGTAPAAFALMDVNADSHLDLIVGDSYGGDITAGFLNTWLGNGHGSFENQSWYPDQNQIIGYPQCLVVGHFTSADPQVAVSGLYSRGAGIHRIVPDGTFQQVVYLPGSDHVPAMASGDFDADGMPDFVLANWDGNRARVHLGTVGYQWPHFDYDSYSTPTAVVSADFNEDGRPDAAVLKQDPGTVMLLMNTTGQTSEAPGPAPGLVPFRILGASPNPAVGEVKITFAAPEAGPVRLVVVDAVGRLVYRDDFPAESGEQVVTWNGKGFDGAPLSAGVYNARLESPAGVTRATRIVLLRQ